MKPLALLLPSLLLVAPDARAGEPRAPSPGRCASLEAMKSLDASPASFTARAMSPDGKLFALGSSDGVVRVWDTAKGALVTTLGEPARARPSPPQKPTGADARGKRPPGDRRKGDPLGVDPLAVDEPAPRAGDNPFLASAAVRGLEFSPSGKTLLVGEGPGLVTEWRLADRKRVTVYEGHRQGVVQAHFSPDGRRVLTLANDQTLRLWDTDGGRPIATLPVSRYFFTNEFSGDGRHVAVSGKDHPVVLVDAETGEVARPVEGLQGGVHDVRFSADGQRVVLSGDPTTTLVDVATGKRVADLDGFYARVSADSRRVLTVKADATLALWDARTGAHVATLRGHENSLYTAEFSPEGSLVVSSSYDGTARLWSASDGKALATLPLGPTWEAWVTRDDACVVTGTEGAIGLFRRSGERTAVVTLPPRTLPMLFDRAGRRLLVVHGQRATLFAIP